MTKRELMAGEKAEAPAEPYPPSKGGNRLREQARESAKEHDRKQAEFATGAKRQGDGV